jgi:serine phosphatase RsbU (regulator of sigma subunit)
MVGAFGSDQLVTLCYVLCDATSGTLRVASAGHPPPSVLRADGTVEQLPFADGPPLGVPAAPRVPVSVPFGIGDTLLAFTDGLIERRDEDIDSGLERLARAVPHLGASDLAAGVVDVVEAVRDDTYDDDMAALALRRIG